MRTRGERPRPRARPSARPPPAARPARPARLADPHRRARHALLCAHSSGVRAGVAANVHAVVGMRTSLTDEELRHCGCALSLASWTELTMELVCSLNAPDRSPEGEASEASSLSDDTQ